MILVYNNEGKHTDGTDWKITVSIWKNGKCCP